jgi:Peptidase M50B-like
MTWFSSLVHMKHHNQWFRNAGGVTKYRGGCRICIIPAGYTGCAFWAGLFVALSGSRIGATGVAAGISVALLVSLLYVQYLTWYQPYSPRVALNQCFLYLYQPAWGTGTSRMELLWESHWPLRRSTYWPLSLIGLSLVLWLSSWRSFTAFLLATTPYGISTMTWSRVPPRAAMRWPATNSSHAVFLDVSACNFGLSLFFSKLRDYTSLWCGKCQINSSDVLALLDLRWHESKFEMPIRKHGMRIRPIQRINLVLKVSPPYACFHSLGARQMIFALSVRYRCVHQLSSKFVVAPN